MIIRVFKDVWKKLRNIKIKEIFPEITKLSSTNLTKIAEFLATFLSTSSYKELSNGVLKPTITQLLLTAFLCNCKPQRRIKSLLLNHTENKEEVGDILHNAIHKIKRISDQSHFFNIFTKPTYRLLYRTWRESKMNAVTFAFCIILSRTLAVSYKYYRNLLIIILNL